MCSPFRTPHSAFQIPHGQRALFLYSFWDGRLGGAQASRPQRSASSPNAQRLATRRCERRPGRSRSPFHAPHGKAADHGYAEAQFNLGAYYANGNGVPRNFIEAYKWVSLAAAQGRENAKKALSKIESYLTPTEIVEAQKRAGQFKPTPESIGSEFTASSEH